MTVCLDEKLFKALVSETNGFPFENYVEMSMLSELNVPYKMVENRETKADAFFIIADPYRTGKGVIGEIGKTITPAYLSCFNNDNSIPSGKQHVDLLKETLFKVWDVYELARIEEQRKKLVDVVDLSSVIGEAPPVPEESRNEMDDSDSEMEENVSAANSTAVNSTPAVGKKRSLESLKLKAESKLVYKPRPDWWCPVEVCILTMRTSSKVTWWYCICRFDTRWER